MGGTDFPEFRSVLLFTHTRPHAGGVVEHFRERLLVFSLTRPAVVRFIQWGLQEFHKPKGVLMHWEQTMGGVTELTSGQGWAIIQYIVSIYCLLSFSEVTLQLSGDCGISQHTILLSKLMMIRMVIIFM